MTEPQTEELTYDQREAAATAERLAKHETLITSVVEHLPGFSLVNDRAAHLGRLIRRDADGITIDASIGGWRADGRVRFGFAWPEEHPGAPGGNRAYPSEYEKRDAGDPTTEITVAETTPPARMARAIGSRLLTASGCALWLAMQARAEGRRSYEAKTADTLKLLCASTGTRLHGSTLYPSSTIPGIYKIDASGDTVRMELHSLPIADAIAVIELLKRGGQ